VRAGRFRQDLYYRLSVLPVTLPPLRERGDDIVLLAEYYVRHFAAQHGLATPTLTPEVRRALLAHPWPGNVRELRNGVERAMLLGDGELRPEDFFLDDAPPSAARADAELPFPAPMEEIERAAARAMVERCGGNKSAAAAALNVSRKRLYALLSEDEPHVDSALGAADGGGDRAGAADHRPEARV
jgi:DNA-binding NtrC family response regulator